MPIKVAFRGNIFAVANSTAGFSLDPSLAVAVLRVFDVLSGVQQSFPVKTPIDITAMRSISSVVYDAKEPVTLFDCIHTTQPS